LIPSSEADRKDSTHVVESISHEDTSVVIPGDSVTFEGEVTDGEMPQVQVRSKTAKLSLQVSGGKLRAECECDSIEALLQKERREKMVFKSSSTKESENKTIVLEKTPTLTKYLSWVGGFAIVLFIVYLIAKIYLPKLP
jgi:hypothetical protein